MDLIFVWTWSSFVVYIILTICLKIDIACVGSFRMHTICVPCTCIHIDILLYFSTYSSTRLKIHTCAICEYNRSIFKTSWDWNITLTRREDTFYSKILVSLKFSRKAFNFYNMIKLSKNIVSRGCSQSWYAYKTHDKYIFLKKSQILWENGLKFHFLKITSK